MKNKVVVRDEPGLPLGGETWEHIASKTRYLIIGNDYFIEKTEAQSVAYKNKDGIKWVRPVDEFLEKFTRIPKAGENGSQYD